MLKWALYIVVGLGGLVGLVAVIGLTLPKGHRASKVATYAAPPDVVFAAISDVARYAEWRPDVKRVELLPDDDVERPLQHDELLLWRTEIRSALRTAVRPTYGC